jgi:outer membrane lipoprotein-sorting protein
MIIWMLAGPNRQLKSKKRRNSMKRLVVVWTIGLFLLGILASPGISQNAKDILNKMIEAQGGKAALEKIKDTTMTGTMEIIQFGMSGSLSIYYKEPDKVRMDMEFMGMVMTQAFDGENGWGVNPQTGAVEDMPEDQAKEMKRMAMGNAALLYPEKYGISYTYKRKETMEGKDYFVLEQAFEDGHTATMYIDADTYLVYKTKEMSTNMAGVQAESEAFYGDYKKVDGVMMPYSMRIVQGGEEAMTMTITDVSFNTGLEDSFFKKEE